MFSSMLIKSLKTTGPQFFQGQHWGTLRVFGRQCGHGHDSTIFPVFLTVLKFWTPPKKTK